MPVEPRERAALLDALASLLPGARRIAGELRLHDGAGRPLARVSIGAAACATVCPAARSAACPPPSPVDTLPVLDVAPLFPGAWLRHGLRLHGLAVAHSRPAPIVPNPLWHYASMTHRPTHGVDARAAPDARALRVNAYTLPGEHPEHVAADIAATLSSLAHTATVSVHGPDARRVAAALGTRRVTVTRSRPLDPEAALDYFTSLADADLAVFGADGRLADALESGVPVLTRAGTTALDHAFHAAPDAPTHPGEDPVADGASAAALGRQRAWLDDARQGIEGDAVIVDDAAALHRALAIWIDGHGIDATLAVPSQARPLLARTAPPIPSSASVVALRARLHGGRRKLVKLRESPRRFARDSRSGLLRRLGGARR